MSKIADVTFVLDRSGSMGCVQKETVQGINKFIEDVSSTPGEGCWTLVQFDDRDSARGAKEEFPHVVFSAVPDHKLPRLEQKDFQPRGGTALVDAVCHTIVKTKERIDALPDKRNRKVMMVIITDGQENSSREFTSANMREKVAEQREQGWEFIYLGANQDAFAEAGKYGTHANMNYAGLAAGSTSTLPFNYGNYGEALCSGSVGVRSWKLDGNESAKDFIQDVNVTVNIHSKDKE